MWAVSLYGDDDDDDDNEDNNGFSTILILLFFACDLATATLRSCFRAQHWIEISQQLLY
jgi:hypothetical protein